MSNFFSTNVPIKNEKASKGYKPLEAIIQAPSGLPFAWFSPDEVMRYCCLDLSKRIIGVGSCSASDSGGDG